MTQPKIKCSRCRKLYNTDSHFGLKPSGVLYKTCLKCRNKEPTTISDDAVIEAVYDNNNDELPQSYINHLLRDQYEINHKNASEQVEKTLQDIEKTLALYKFNVERCKLSWLNEMLMNDQDTLIENLHFKNKAYVANHGDLAKVLVKVQSETSIWNYVRHSPTNIFEFMKPIKLTGPRRCEVCMEKTFRTLLTCQRCNHRVCKGCFSKTINYLTCSFCRYKFDEHVHIEIVK